jgi:hypothetical protein
MFEPKRKLGYNSIRFVATVVLAASFVNEGDVHWTKYQHSGRKLK